jgi:hypothetical protein
MLKKIVFASLMVLFPSFAPAQTLVDIATNATDPNNLDDSEPSIAVNPLNPQQIAVVSFSGGWTFGGAGAPMWVSNNGGTTWSKNLVLTAPSAASTGPGDQKLVYSAAGTLYVAELGGGLSVPRCFIYRPSGANWIAGAAFGDDQPMMESSGSTRLAPWLNFGVSPEQSTSERSTNDGVTVAQTGIGSTAFPNRTTRIAVGPTGTAYVIYKTRQGINGNFETATFRVVRSTDAGVTWNSPGIPVHPGTVQTWFTSSWGNNKNGGKFARARSSDAWIAVNPTTGAIWAVYCNRDASTFGQIYAVRSNDGGATWSAPVRVTDGTRNSAYPEVAVAANGTVGVMYIDYDDSGTQTVYTHRLARSYNNGATWSRAALQSLTTQALSNGTPGFLWGDYEGLTAVGNTFYGVFTGQSIGRAVVQLDPIFVKASAVPASISSAIGVINVDAGRPYAFVKGGDGNMWVNWWSGSAWGWANQGTPSGVAIASPVGAITVDGGRPYVFVKGGDGNMWVNWWSGSAWGWANQGTPSGVGIASAVGAITVDGGRPYAFIKGSDGNLWVNWWSGSAWGWANQGKPSGVGIASAVGAITVDGGRPYAFVLGSDGNLWVNWWSGSAWNWANQGKPSGVGIASAVGAITVDGGRPYVFVKGSDGNLWVNWWSGSAWGWANQGKPSGVGIASAVGAITVDGGRPYAFVLGSDGNLWVNWWSGSAWNWANQGTPSGVGINLPVGAITVDGGRPYVFVRGSDGNLWVNWWSGSAWGWANQGLPEP